MEKWDFSKKLDFSLCLKTFRFLQDFRSHGMLFQVLGPRNDMEFCPMFVLRKGILNLFAEFRVNFAVSRGTKMSDIYFGEIPWKWLYAVTLIRWFTLSFTVSQFISSNSFLSR